MLLSTLIPDSGSSELSLFPVCELCWWSLSTFVRLVFHGCWAWPSNNFCWFVDAQSRTAGAGHCAGCMQNPWCSLKFSPGAFTGWSRDKCFHFRNAAEFRSRTELLAFKRGGRVAGDWCGSCQGAGVRAAGDWRAGRKRGGGGLTCSLPPGLVQKDVQKGHSFWTRV